MRKRLLSMLLILVLAAQLLTLPAGASGSSRASTHRADLLASLNLFQGTGSGYQLDGMPTRLHGLIMLIRLLGQEDEALAFGGTHSFDDVKHSGKTEKYVAYGVTNGLANGVSTASFAPNGPLKATHFVTFLLRALGYDDRAEVKDFSVSTSLNFAAGLSLMTEEAAQALAGANLNRGDMVDLAYAALACKLKDGSMTLAQKLAADGVFTQEAGVAAGVLGDGAGWTYTYTPYDQSTVTYSKQVVSTSGGDVTAHVLTVNTANPKVTVKSDLVNKTLGNTKPFSEIVQESGAVAVVNGNFFDAYGTSKMPIGHVMVDGEFLYGNSGLNSLGITEYGELRVGRPAVFARVISSDGSRWAAYEINTTSQRADVATLYTPAYGSVVTLTADGYIMTVQGGTITAYELKTIGAEIAIPADGFVVYMGEEYMSYAWNRTPVAGCAVTTEYYLQREDEEGFVLDDLVSIITGAPRLVQDGEIVTTLENGFTEKRFTTMSTSRTAVGINVQGKLLLVSVPSATIQQMRELMLSLGCVDAFNIDGGASCGMYYDGTYLSKPSRELTSTVQVFVEE